MAKQNSTEVKVLKPFPYAHNGHAVKNLAAGDTAEIWDDQIPDLIDEGFVADPAAKSGRQAKTADPAE